MRRLRHRPGGVAHRRVLRRARGPGARVRVGADPHRLAHRPALRHQRPLRLDRRAHPATCDGAHVEYFSRIRNPIGIKLGPTTTPDEALAYLDRLDPDREPGRLSFIVRMGAGNVREKLPALVEKVRGEGHQVAWICDPMHGNTFEAPSGHKTRRFDDVLDEVKGFFEVHRGAGHAPRRHPRRADRRRRHRVRRRRRGDRVRRPAPALRVGLRPAAQPHASRWTWRSWSRRCYRSAA